MAGWIVSRGRLNVIFIVVNDFHDRIRRMLDESDAPVPLAEHHGRAMLGRTFRHWLAFFAAHRDAAAVILKEATAIDPRFEAALARLCQLGLDYFAGRFRRVQALGLVNGAVAPELVAHLQVGMVDELVNAFILSDASADIDGLSAALAPFAWDGIRPGTRG